MADNAALATLRRASAALDTANRTLENERYAAAEHDQQSHATAKRLADLEAAYEIKLIAARLGDAPSRPEIDAVEIVRLRAQVTADERAEPVIKSRIARAEKAAVAAEKTFKAAARAHLIEHAQGPKVKRLNAALDEVGAAAADLMGLHEVTYGRFGNEYASGGFGPAAELIRHVGAFRWSFTAPYSFAPNWKPTFDFAPWKIAGVVEGQKAALTLIEEATR